ncbi:MAG: alcohol dehydrogenase catalytic domain-containing protein [Dictyoglomaceae bacterium]|nr:alcohol dehydrogenase catalytic domain-containing protein [Dictyoglomaceae bacterium]
MKAVVVYGPFDYRLEERPIPKIGKEEVLVKVLATGICASDVKTYYGFRVWGTEDIPAYIQAPVIPGHEFVGEVVELGEGAKEKYGLDIEDMVVSEQIIPCGKCRFCKEGKYWMCQQHDIYGFIKEKAEGSWAQFMKYPANAINHKVPKSIKPEYAATIEPLACAIHAVERGNIQLGDVVVIAGMGPIGLFMLQVAKLKGPDLVIAIDLKSYRLEIAKKLGADIVINPLEEDAVQRVFNLTEGYGCDVYIEASGSKSAIIQGLKMIRRLGTFVEFGVHSEPVCVDWSVIGDVKELNIYGAHLGPYCYPKAIKYLEEGKVRADLIVTHTLPLENFKEGIELVHEGDKSLKVILIP